MKSQMFSGLRESSIPRVPVEPRNGAQVFLSIRSCSLQVLTAYRVELVRWGAEKLENERLVARIDELSNQAHATALEGNLCRALKKANESEIEEACKKWLAHFADAKPDLVHATLWTSARKAAKLESID